MTAYGVTGLLIFGGSVGGVGEGGEGVGCGAMCREMDSCSCRLRQGIA